MDDVFDAPIAVIGAVAVFVGTLFQVGFFLSFGVEYLSTASIGDWLFYIAAVGMSILPFLILIQGLISRFEDRAEEISETYIHPTMMTALFFATGWIIYAQSTVAAFAVIALYMSWLSALSLHRRVKEYGETRKLGLSGLGATFARFAIAALTAGAVYAETIAGRDCLLTFAAGRELHARYMRSVSDGHLVQLTGNSYYYPKSEITEIRCPQRRQN